MKIAPEKIEKAQTLWKQGVQRKRIAKIVGISERAVGRACDGMAKPVEHRGSKAKPSRRLAIVFERTWGLDE